MSSFKCAVCGGTINGTFYTTEHNQSFCSSHLDPPRCRYCLHVLRQGESEPCAQCLSTGFSNELMARPSIERVASWIERHIGPHSLLQVPVQLTDAVHFSPKQSGLTNWRYDGNHLDVDIEMLKLSQANIFEPTLAHEYGHVILVANPLDLSFTGGIGQARLQEEEGFCEVLRYLWVSENNRGSNDLQLKAITDNSDPLYGDGFRIMWPKYKAAGSVMNLRADMLGLSRQPFSTATSWPFGKKKRTNNQSDTQPLPVLPSPHPQHLTPTTPSPSSPTVIEGGSHRPMIDIGFDKTSPRPAAPTSAVVTNDHRPTIELTPTSHSKNAQQTAPQTSPDNDDNRPTIRFD